MLSVVIGIGIVVFIGAAFWQATQKGKFKERARYQAKKKEAIDAALDAQDRVVSDDDYRKRVRDEYDG